MAANSEIMKDTFNWYTSLLDLAKFEITHGRTRFYEMAKIHAWIFAGILAISSYAISNAQEEIFVLAGLISLFGIFIAYAWWKQIISSSTWEGRWLNAVVQLEESDDFRNRVGARSVKVFSNPKIKAYFDPASKQYGATPRMYKTFVMSVVVFYSVALIGLIIIGLASATGKSGGALEDAKSRDDTINIINNP
ncbi:hypothetical protein ACFLQW_00205 [Candidatus Zixiibacteriota bacterium]